MTKPTPDRSSIRRNVLPSFKMAEKGKKQKQGKTSQKPKKSTPQTEEPQNESKMTYVIVLVIVVSVIVAVTAYISQLPGGYITTQGGSTCSWRLAGHPHTERRLMLDCECPSGITYYCEYEGTPDTTCPPFWRDFIGFFRQIRQAAAGEYTIYVVIFS